MCNHQPRTSCGSLSDSIEVWKKTNKKTYKTSHKSSRSLTRPHPLAKCIARSFHGSRSASLQYQFLFLACRCVSHGLWTAFRQPVTNESIYGLWKGLTTAGWVMLLDPQPARHVLVMETTGRVALIQFSLFYRGLLVYFCYLTTSYVNICIELMFRYPRLSSSLGSELIFILSIKTWCGGQKGEKKKERHKTPTIVGTCSSSTETKTRKNKNKAL